MTNTAKQIRRMTISAVFLSIALVLKTYFSISIPLLGENGMRMGIAGIFTMVPAILFGPFYGGAVSALADVLGYLLRPEGAYMPLMTLSAFVGGFLRGGIWMLLREAKDKHLRVVVSALVLLSGAFGAWNIYALAADGVNAGYYNSPEAGDTHGFHWISRMVVERTQNMKDPAGSLPGYLTFFTAGFIAIAIFGAILVAGDFILGKVLKKNGVATQTMAVVLALVLAGAVNTTINTVILRETLYESWKVLPFSVVWLPRIIEEVLANIVKSYFVVLLYDVLSRQRAVKKLVPARLPFSKPDSKSLVQADKAGDIPVEAGL